MGILTAYGTELAEKADLEYDTAIFKRRRLTVLGEPREKTRTFIQVSGIPELSVRWDKPERWQLVTAGPYLGTTALSISDNLVSILAFEKGRSGSRALNRFCRRAAAYQLACRIQWRLRHIPTDRNISDGPSRM